jgi:probable F420-dependent oxidoreductase
MMAPMRFGIMFANTVGFSTEEGAKALASAADDTGIESLWAVEHVVVPSGYRSTYPYSPDGKMPGGEDFPIPDPLIWLAYVAAASTHVKLATGVAIVPQRNPIYTAKEVATLDQLSGGRMILGVGAGWLEEEFDALGVPFARRGERLDEYVAAIRALWTQDKPSFDGEFVSFTEAICRPQPVNGTVPIVVGGHTERAARRAGRLGDGFFPATPDLKLLARLIDVMRRSAEEAGRDPDAIEVSAGGLADAGFVERLAALGVRRMVLPPLSWDPAGIRPALESFASDVIAKVGDA